MNERAKMVLTAIAVVVTLTHFGNGQTNSTSPGRASLVVINQNPLASNPTEITTLDGMTYKSARIVKVEPDGLMIEYAPQTGGIGLGKIKFVNLSAELRLKYGFDARKASEYESAKAAGEAKLRREMQLQQEQAWAAERARAEENFKARLEMDRQAEVARVQAEKERAAQIKEEAERNREVYSVGTGSSRGAAQGRGK